MYKRLMRFPIHADSLPPSTLVKNYENNYFAMYTRLTRYRLRLKLGSPAYLGLGII